MEKVVGCGAPARKKVGVWGPGRGRRWEIGGWPWPYVSVVRGIRRWGMGGWWCVGWGWERGEGLVVVGWGAAGAADCGSGGGRPGLW